MWSCGRGERHRRAPNRPDSDTSGLKMASMANGSSAADVKASAFATVQSGIRAYSGR